MLTLLCADSMYGSSVFDGKLKIVSVNEANEISIEHFVQTNWGVT